MTYVEVRLAPFVPSLTGANSAKRDLYSYIRVTIEARGCNRHKVVK
jgi:hypothetical protein